MRPHSAASRSISSPAFRRTSIRRTPAKVFVENLKYAAPKLKAAGIKLLIEAINTRDIPGFFLTSTKQAIGIIDEVGSDNLFFQYDIYHMQIMEGDLARTIEANLPKIAHIQLADNPGRNEPGTGEINYPVPLPVHRPASAIRAGSARNTNRRATRSRVSAGCRSKPHARFDTTIQGVRHG